MRANLPRPPPARVDQGAVVADLAGLRAGKPHPVAMAVASAVHSRETAVRHFLLRCFGGGGALGGGDTKSSERNDGQVEENAMADSSSSSASEPLPEPSSPPPAAAPWLLLLTRTGHLKFLREKEKEDSWGLLAMMVLMVPSCGRECGIPSQSVVSECSRMEALYSASETGEQNPPN